MSTSRWSEDNEFGLISYFISKKTIHEMGFGFYGANQTCKRAHGEQIHIGCDGLCHKVGGSKNSMNEHNYNHNQIHL
jgi:hypothetical protein